DTERFQVPNGPLITVPWPPIAHNAKLDSSHEGISVEVSIFEQLCYRKTYGASNVVEGTGLGLEDYRHRPNIAEEVDISVSERLVPVRKT
ncbi:MAG: hypothetical protein WAU76_18535, partial [Candidatus Sulfotelmatobacter sp.]